MMSPAILNSRSTDEDVAGVNTQVTTRMHNLVPKWRTAKSNHIFVKLNQISIMYCQIKSFDSQIRSFFISVFIHDLSTLCRLCTNHLNLPVLIPVILCALRYFFLSVQYKPTDPPDQTHFISVQLHFMLNLHWSSLTAINENNFLHNLCVFHPSISMKIPVRRHLKKTGWIMSRKMSFGVSQQDPQFGINEE